MQMLKMSDSHHQSRKEGARKTKELQEVVKLIAKRCRNDETAVCLGWIKSHIGIEGNKAADEEAKKAAEGKTPLGKANSATLITEGGVNKGPLPAGRRKDNRQVWD